MALAKIKKVEIIGLRDCQEQILAFLQKQGNIELISLQLNESNHKISDDSLNSDLDRLDEAISYLATYEKKSGFIENLAGLKPIVYDYELEQLILHFDWRPIIDEMRELKHQYSDLRQQQTNLDQKKQLLLPWKELTLSLDKLHSSQYCDIVLGVINARDYHLMREALAESGIPLHLDLVSQDKAHCHLALIFIKDNWEKIENILNAFHFHLEQLGSLQASVEENLREISKQIHNIKAEIAGILKRLHTLSENGFRLKMLYDILGNNRSIRLTGEHLLKQEYTFSLSGWIKASEQKDLEKKLINANFPIALFISDPHPNEEVPVILENRGFFKPFEFITQIYGMPKYGEIDPTPFLAPFFFLYFGFCVSDVGYGLILMAISWWIMRKYKIGPTGTNFWRMLMFCGISTIVVGILTGSWFGNLFDLFGENFGAMKSLARWKDSLIILDPMKEPTKLLGVALSLGIIQVWFGSIVAAIGNIKNHRYLDIFLDQVPILCFLFGLTGFGLSFLQLIGKSYLTLFKTTISIGGICLILTQGRSEKGIGAKLFYGIYYLYNSLSGYLSDILSYSRLWALGLVTGVMAVTINLLAIQFSQIVPTIFPFINRIPILRFFISAVALILIFVFGHLLSILMNLLGAFVHPLRLQFVEFFSKFFKPGGNRFKPFKNDSKFINIKYERS